MAFDVGAIVARLELNDKNWRQAIGRVTKDNSLSGYVLRNQQAIQSLGKTFTIAGAGIVGSLGMMIKKAADYGDNMDEMSQKTGVAIGVLSGLKLAADKDGTSIESLAMGLKGLSGKIVEANSGNKEAVALFGKLGVSVTDANGKIRPMKDVLFDSATAFSKMGAGAEKTKTAVDLFGRAGMEMIPLLNRGADGLEREWKEAERLGLVLDEKTGKAASDFNDQLENLQGSLMGVAVQMGQALMPTIQKLITTLTSVIAGVRAWAAEHPGLSALLAKVALAVGALLTALGPVLIMLPKLIQGFTLLKTVLPGVASLLSPTGIIVLGLGAIAFAAIKAKNEFQDMATLIKAEAESTGQKVSWFSRTWESLNAAVVKLTTGVDAAAIAHAKLKEKQDAAAPGLTGLYDLFKKYGTQLKDGIVPAIQKVISAHDEEKKKIQALNPELKTAIENSDALGKTKKILTQIVETLIPKMRNLDRVLGEIGATITATTIPPARNLTRVLQDIAPSMEDIPKTAEAVTRQTGGYFDGLMTDIASGIGTAMGTLVSEIGKGMNFADMEFFRGGINFKKTFDAIWTNVKQGFFRMVGEMITDWAMRGMKSLVSSTVEAASKVGQSAAGIGTAFKGIGGIITGLATTIGTVLTTLATAVGTSIMAIATAIGGAIVALATSIATAATALAAAAPALVVVGLIATGVYAATKLLGALLGGSSKQTDVTYWLKPISERAQEIRDWLFINAQERLNFLNIQITDLKTVLIAHVGDRLMALTLQTGKQLQTLYQGINPYLRVIAAESDWLSKIYLGIVAMTKALTSKHTIYVRDEILTAKMGEANQGIKKIAKPINGPFGFDIPNRPISGPVSHDFDIPNRPISGPIPWSGPGPKPKPKPMPIPIEVDTVTWLKRIHARIANISNILVGVFTTPTFSTPDRPISGPIPGKTFGFGGPGGRGDINRAAGANVNITFNISSIDSRDTERFINDRARPTIIRTIQRAFKTRELHVPASAVGGS